MTSTQRNASFIFLIAVLVYLPALANGFAFDDLLQIVENPAIRSVDQILKGLLAPTYPGDLYRPLPLLSYGIINLFWGLNPLPYHLINLLLHGLASVLVGLLFSRVISARVGFYTAILFAIAPIHVEAVANVVGRAELLSAIGVLGALLIFLRSPEQNRFLLLVSQGLLLFLACLSKESAVVCPLLSALLVYQLRMLDRRWIGLSLAIQVVAIGSYLALRVYALGSALGSGAPIAFVDNPLLGLSATERFGAAISVLGRYLFLIVAPLQLSADYSYPEILPSDAINILFAVIALAFLAAGLWSFKRHRAEGFCVAWFFLAFTVTSNVLFPIGTIMGERLAYLPSAGVLAAGALIYSRISSQTIRAAAGIVICLLFSLKTVLQAQVWKDNQSLHTSQLTAAPRSAKVQLNYSMLKREQGDLVAADLYARRALELYPQYAHAAFAIGDLYALKGIVSGADHWYKKALEFEPKHKESLAGLGRLAINRGDNDQAEKLFLSSLATDPGYFDAQLGMLAVYIQRRELDRAQPLASRLLEWKPDSPQLAGLVKELKKLKQ